MTYDMLDPTPTTFGAFLDRYIGAVKAQRIMAIRQAAHYESVGNWHLAAVAHDEAKQHAATIVRLEAV